MKLALTNSLRKQTQMNNKLIAFVTAKKYNVIK
jgi:hypothetical protein